MTKFLSLKKTEKLVFQTEAVRTEGISAAYHTHFKSSSDSPSMDSGESMEIKETSTAPEQTEIKGTSAAAGQTEIEVTSDIDAVWTEGTSAADHTHFKSSSDSPSMESGESTEIKETSTAAEQTEIKATSDADDLRIKGISAAAGQTKIEVTSDTKAMRTKGTSAADHTHFKSSSDSASMESGESMDIKETSTAAEQTEIKATSHIDALRIKGTSAVAGQTEIEVTSDTDAVRTEGTSAAEHTHFKSSSDSASMERESMEIKETSTAAEKTEIKATSDADALRIKGTSAAAGQTEIEVTSDTDAVRTEGTSAADHTHFKSSSDSASMESGESMEIKETSTAAEQTEIKATSDADALRIKGTSAAAGQTEIEETSDTEAVQTEGTSAADHTHFKSSSDSASMESRESSEIKETSTAAEKTEIKATSDADALRIKGTSAAAGQTEIEETSDTEAVRTEGTSTAAEQTEIEETSDTEAIFNLYFYIFGPNPNLPSPYQPYQQFPEIQRQSFPVPAADAVQNEGTSAAAEDTESVESTQWPTNSIFRAPAHIKNNHEPFFEPKLVSIGPYYHGQENLRRMEDLKLRIIPEILMKKEIPRWHQSVYNVPVESSRQGEISIDDDLYRFMNSGKKARAYYQEECKHSFSDFVRILVIDSCFIIRTILSLSQQVEESMAFLDVNIKDIRSDLFILENQIPLFFIREVYDWLSPVALNQQFPHFDTVLEPFICLDMPWTINHDGMMSSEKAAHLLDLYWRCSLSPPMYNKLSELERDLCEKEKHGFEQEQLTRAEIHPSNNEPKVIENATELNKIAGIEFKKFKHKGLDVSFSKGIIQMPCLKTDTRQTNLLINLIAFENCILPGLRTFSCHMKLMGALIGSERDVKLLQKCSIINNTLRSHEITATFFDDIGDMCFMDNKANHYSGFYKNVQRYYNSCWHRGIWLSLQQNYFSSPWTVISVIARVTLLILSALQTFYTIYGYYKPKK